MSHRHAIPWLCVLLAAAAVSCTPSTRGPDRGAAVENLLAADRTFASDVAKDGLAGWLRWFEDDGAQIEAGRVYRGRRTIEGLMAPLFAQGNVELTWEPEGGDVAASGDLGYTWGRYEVRGTDDRGTGWVRRGRYVTVWRHRQNGTWRVALDIGNEPCLTPIDGPVPEPSP